MNLDNHTILYIIQFLDDHSKNSFIRSNAKLYTLNKSIIYCNEYCYDKIVDIIDKGYKFKWISFFTDNINIPNCITHLTFNDIFNKNIKECILNSVTHLTFGIDLNQDIKECIPNSVTHLTFGRDFNQDIKECIPNSVTHLTFSGDFNQDIKGCIPNSVTHLTFDRDFNQDIKGCIPNSV